MLPETPQPGNELDDIKLMQRDAQHKELIATLEALTMATMKEKKTELKGAEIVTIKGEKGDKGDKGEKGDSITGPQGPKGDKGDKGDPGKDGKDGKDGRDGVDGKPGKDGKDGKVGKTGPQGSPDTAEQIRDKLKGLKKGQRLHFDDLDGTEWVDKLQLGRHSPHATGRLQDLVDVLVTVEPSNGQVLAWNSTSKDWQPTTVTGGGGLGDVVGPASATNGDIALFDGTTGKLIKDSGKALSAYFEKAVDDTDDITEGATNKFNATHTGDVTGATALTIDKTAITGKSAVTAVGTDYILISDTSDSGNLKKALASDLASAPGGSDTQLQFNDGGSFGGDADLTWNKTTNVLGINGSILFPDDALATTWTISGANQTTADTNGNDINIIAGNGLGTGSGGRVQFYSGNGGADGYGADIEFYAGSGGVTQGNGGSFNIVAGNATTLGDGGGFGIYAGNGAGNGSTGGPVAINAGDAGGTGSFGGPVIIGAGNCFTDGDGGNFLAVPGAGAGGGVNGKFGIKDPTSTYVAYFATSGITTADKTYTLPDASGTFALTSNKLSAFAATTSAELKTVISDETGSGALVFADTPTLVTPVLGTPTSGTLTNCTGLPISSGVSGLGTGVATALGVNTGSAGAVVLFNGALGTPSSGTLTNCTFPTLNQNTTGSAASLSISGQSGLLTFTGLTTVNRAKTVRDAADTILELGGSYTPTGTWTNMTLVTPALGTPSSGTLTNCTGLPVAGITSSTSTALGVGSLEVGHASDTTISRSSAGVIAVEGVTVPLNSTTNTHTAQQIELGHASDTTLSRSSAGVLAVEGVVIPSISSTNTLTNKRVTPRVGTTTSSATPTINTDNVDMYGLTAQAVDITSFTTNLSGTPTDGQKLWIYIVGTAARAITWGSSFEASTVSLPTTTVSTNRLDVGFVWNAATSKWRCVASG